MNVNYKENNIKSNDNEKIINEKNNLNNIEKNELINNCDLNKNNEEEKPNNKNDINSNNNNLIQSKNHIKETNLYGLNNNISIQFEKVNYINEFISKITREINFIIKEFKELSINKIFEYCKSSDRNSIIKIFFVWLIFFLDIGIFFKNDLSELFFSDTKKFLYLLLIMLLFLVIFKAMLILIYPDSVCYKLLFILYIIVLGFTLFKSVVYSKGWGWPFYLIIFLININLVMIENKKYIEDCYYDKQKKI